MLGNIFCTVAINALFEKDPTIDWAIGPPWSNGAAGKFNLLYPIDSSPLAAEIKLGPQRIGARTDGGLQILLPQTESFVAWDRSYYEIALEAKRFFKTESKDGIEHISEIKQDSIHSGQIFAEMLGAVNHPEFFDHSDVEVLPLPI